jgi:predicted DCC family thiol-disulfide oxidoreductase YuxK
MYQKWTELGGWTPFFRIDQYPLLYKLGAMGTIFFETSFIFLLFSKRFRLLAPLGGLFFHAMTDVFMRISFGTLWRCYVAFFDWHKIFTWVGAQLFREEMYIVYDSSCKLCRRTVATLRVFDILGRVTYLNPLDDDAFNQHGLERLDTNRLMTDIHAVVGKKIRLGFMAYRALAARIPVLWPVLPVLYLWPIPKLGERTYRHVADSRTCSIIEHFSSCAKPVEYDWSSKAVTVVGSIILVATFGAGAWHVHDAWPIAGYPTFAGIAGSTADLVEIYAVIPTGETVLLNTQAAGELDTTRVLGLMNQALAVGSEAERRIRIEALWKLFAQNSPRLQAVDAVRFYQVALSTIPERQGEDPLSRKLLLEFKPGVR